MATALSVVVPTHNGSGRIAPLLRALAEQSLDPQESEVLVVDNGSSAGSAERIEASPEFKTLARVTRARVIALDHAGLTNARIAGVRACGGDVVLFLDDDAEPDRSCCSEALQAFAEPRVGVAFGRVYPKYPREPGYCIRKREGVLAINHRLGDTPILWKGPNEFAPTLGVALAVRTSAFLDSYPWREPARLLGDRVGDRMASGGDMEIGQFLGRAGWWRVYNPRMVVNHAIDERRLQSRSFARLIVGIERSRATFEDKFQLGPPPVARRLRAAGEAAAIIVLAPAWIASRDGYLGWWFALASRAGRLLGAYRGAL